MKQYVADAFTDRVFAGNPTTICILDKWLPEDPVCGSGHCHIAPYWAAVLGKKELVAYQASPRGGTLWCSVEGDRVKLAGKAALYSQAEIFLD